MTGLHGPDPDRPYPMADHRRVCFIKNFIQSPNIIVGDYSYYDDPVDPEGFERNVLYNYGSDRLIIGKFCAIATGVKFIMGGANHKLDGISTYPFPIFGQGWETEIEQVMNLPSRGDTIVSNDVWIGYESLIMPGVRIGDGAVIAARSVVVKDIPPYTIAGGNPAQPIKQRFNDTEVAQLLEIKWWDWDRAKITRSIHLIMGNNIQALYDAR
ncbi:CatB-related O-acetyltransferase [Leptothermofonsia sichuanensis]|uniref:CatB-related O-acetyltransferase n=1 Tax=Leptothermofonsia sichuanensis TaxID=2917832 RepID=UPI00201BC761|nr:CatB-related O-acetyltransferase [Leptothermofonsia sichuanensis]